MISNVKLYNELQSSFSTGERTIVFWYDPVGEFSDTVDSLDLTPVKIHRLDGKNQFETKYLIERKFPAESFLIYAPYPRPKPEDDFLLDTFLLGEEFCFDSLGILCGELGAPVSARPIFGRFKRFFNSVERTVKFNRFHLEQFGEREVALGVMGALCGVSGAVYGEILTKILFGGDPPDRLIDEFSKYDVIDPFWREAERQFGLPSEKQNINDFVLSLFLTDLVKNLDQENIPDGWRPFILPRANNAAIFLKNVRDNRRCADAYRNWAEKIAGEAALNEHLRQIAAEGIEENETFDQIDQLLIERLADRFLVPDGLASSKDIPRLCAERAKTFFGEKHRSVYQMFENAFVVLKAAGCRFSAKAAEVAGRYQAEYWKIDQAYRRFYTAFDRLGKEQRELSRADEIRRKVEQVYNNEYLEKVTAAWTKALAGLPDLNALAMNRQIHFYKDRIDGKLKERTVVIISDGLRYEAARELTERLNGEKRITASIDVMLGALPSITELGMLALLPHQKLGYSRERFTIDGKAADNLEKRKQILQSHHPAADALALSETIDLDSDGLYARFSSAKLYYVYHNQIDARGDKPASEKEVFRACEEAIDEIVEFVNRLGCGQSRISHLIITADHGFLYRRDALSESDKIAGNDAKSDGKRYAISKNATETPGLVAFPLGEQLESDNKEMVIVPIGPHIYKHPGAGLNYVHGGASPQEVLVPVIDVKVARSEEKFTAAGINLIGTDRKITSLHKTLEFIQDNPVGEQVKPGSYDLVFVDEEGNEVSDHQTWDADSTEKESARRIFELHFNLHEIKYDPRKTYHLIMTDREGRIHQEKARWPFTIDIIFSEDFGF
ncbi:MAG: BREX-1 system phosphatase PglZ type A [Thermoguttaceae bacterium]|nr:BREX-1 system phosphatase PglZ type A [Thermoguttaceae bacterium]